MPLLHIGLDDTDSRQGMCTTYLAYKIVDFLLKLNAKFLDYPLLVRLNPNIPWKTRGNGAIALHVEVNNENIVVKGVKNLVEKNSHTFTGANPCVVFYSGKTIPIDVKELTKKAYHDVISRKFARKVAQTHGIYTYELGNGRGIVGALSAIGAELHDYTFEIIAYRKYANHGKPREISKMQIISMNERTYPNTYNNYDYKNERVLITPRGPDPIFCGIRGEADNILLRAFLMLDIQEELEGYIIFRTNQGTNMHLTHELDLSRLKPHTSGFMKGTVENLPYTIKGGHTFFNLKTQNGIAFCAVYEPTGLSQLSQRLSISDLIEIGGGVRKATMKHPKVINLEYIKILQLAHKLSYINPQCKRCGKRLKSAGFNKGYKCESCGVRERTIQKISTEISRDVKEGLYIPLPKAQRHLTKPIQRYGIEKYGWEWVLKPNWYCRFGSYNSIQMDVVVKLS